MQKCLCNGLLRFYTRFAPNLRCLNVAKKKLLLCVEVKVLCLSNKCKQADKVNVSMKCGTAMPFAMRLDYVILHFEGKPRI